MKKLIPYILLLVISCTGSEQLKTSTNVAKKDSNSVKLCSSSEIKYGLIRGKIVNGRSEPSINGKVEYKFVEGELIFYISKSEKQDTINGDTDYWYNVENQDGEKVWVFGKFIKVLEPNVFDYCIYENIIKKEINPRLWSEKNPETREKGDDLFFLIKFERVDFNNKKYYIIRFRRKGRDPFSGNQIVDGGSSSIFGIYNNEIKYIRGVSNYNLKYSFYDLENDGYTEFFIQNRITSLIIISEKGKKNLSPGWGFGGKMPDELLDSYLEVKEIVPGKECEIIKHYRFAKDQPMRVTRFKWDGQKFVEGPIE